MNNNELIARYIYAVTRRLPRKIRTDVEQELNTLISDMLDERCGDMSPTDTDVKVVLTELGTPAELASKYDPNGEKSLIGPKYFPTYLNVLKIVLIAGGIGVFIAMMMSLIVEGLQDKDIYSFMGEVLASVWNTLLASFGMVTAIFAFLEHKKVDIFSEEDIMKLPSVPKEKEKISRTDSIVGIVFCVLLLVIFIFAPHLMGVTVSSIGDTNSIKFIPFFNTETIHSVWYLFAISFGVQIVNYVYRLIVGRYNFKVAIVTAVTCIINTVASGFILLNDRIMNSQFETALNEAITADGGPAELAPLMSNGLAVLIFAIIVLANVADIAKAFIKAAQYREK